MIDQIEITNFKPTEDGEGTLFIAKVDQEYDRFVYEWEKAKGQAQMQMDDGRTITAKQRMKAWATIGDIAFWLGWNPREVHEFLKVKYIEFSGEPMFSLSDCSIDTARHYISFLIEFVIAEGIPLEETVLKRVEDRPEDITQVLYYCLVYKKCCISGKPAELHHIDTIGMGNDRKKTDDSKSEKIALAPKYHEEAHKIGWEAFKQKYHVFGIIFDQKTIERKFGSDLFW